MATSSTETNANCTCTKCVDGWLSPRMREWLEHSANVRYALAKSPLDADPEHFPSVESSVMYLPLEVRMTIGPVLTPDMDSGDLTYRGFVAVFRLILDLISKTPQGFPTASDIEARLAELAVPAKPDDAPKDKAADEGACLAMYVSKGGCGAYALDCIVDRAREELSPLGAQYDAEKAYIDAVLDGGADKAVDCANDARFDVVRARLGLAAESLVASESANETWRPGKDDEDDELLEYEE